MNSSYKQLSLRVTIDKRNDKRKRVGAGRLHLLEGRQSSIDIVNYSIAVIDFSAAIIGIMACSYIILIQIANFFSFVPTIPFILSTSPFEGLFFTTCFLKVILVKY